MFERWKRENRMVILTYTWKYLHVPIFVIDLSHE